MTDAPADCTACGACCFSESPRHVRVTGEDYERLGDDAEAWVTWLGNEAYLRLAPVAGGDGPRACAALRYEAETRRFLCAVYERRPAVCRDLERGSGACAGERAHKHPRALAVVASVTPRP